MCSWLVAILPAKKFVPGAVGDNLVGRPFAIEGPLKLVFSVLSGSSNLFFSLLESAHFGETETEIATLMAEGEE